MFEFFRSTKSDAKPPVSPPESPRDEPTSTLSLNFGGQELSESDAQNHFAFIGTTGSGKTLMMRLLMQSVLPQVGSGKGYRALVYDAKQDVLPIISAYCSRRRVCTLNPFDQRGVAWDISADVTEAHVAMEIAFTLIPDASESQPYFANASRHILYGIMAVFLLREKQWTLADLIRVAGNSSLCARFLQSRPETSSIVSKYFQEERLLNDIFSTLATKLLLYEPIAAQWEHARQRVSLKQWIQNEWILVLGNSEVSRYAIDNINRCIFKRATDLTLMQREGTPQRNWFFIDEVSEAGRLTSLPSLLKKGRSKGARVAIAFQSISGLRDPKLYGQYGTDDILGQISNRFCGRVECAETAEYLARYIGDAEVRQFSGSQSSSPQGTTHSTSWQNAVRRVILPSEFMSITACGRENGLTGLFTTRSDLPTWDHISGSVLFDELLIPAVDDVPEFLPRDHTSQFLLPWTPEQENVMCDSLGIHSPLDELSPRAQSRSIWNTLD